MVVVWLGIVVGVNLLDCLCLYVSFMRIVLFGNGSVVCLSVWIVIGLLSIICSLLSGVVFLVGVIIFYFW